MSRRQVAPFKLIRRHSVSASSAHGTFDHAEDSPCRRPWPLLPRSIPVFVCPCSASALSSPARRSSQLAHCLLVAVAGSSALGVSSKAGFAAAAAGCEKWHMAGSDGSMAGSRCSRADVGQFGWCRSVAVQNTGSSQAAGSKLDGPADKVDNSLEFPHSLTSRSGWWYARRCCSWYKTAQAQVECWGWVLDARTEVDRNVWLIEVSRWLKTRFRRVGDTCGCPSL